MSLSPIFLQSTPSPSKAFHGFLSKTERGCALIPCEEFDVLSTKEDEEATQGSQGTPESVAEVRENARACIRVRPAEGLVHVGRG